MYSRLTPEEPSCVWSTGEEEEIVKYMSLLDNVLQSEENSFKLYEQKIFHCEIVVDAEKVRREEKAYKKIPVITDFTDGDGNDRMKETVQANYRRIKEEVKQIVQEELERIANDENLKHLLQQK
jgi:hypothetical protein